MPPPRPRKIESIPKITSSISTSLDVRPDVQIFKRPKNREDGSKFDQMNRLGATHFWKIVRKNETIEKFSKNFKKFPKIKSKTFSNDVIYLKM